VGRKSEFDCFDTLVHAYHPIAAFSNMQVNYIMYASENPEPLSATYTAAARKGQISLTAACFCCCYGLYALELVPAASIKSVTTHKSSQKRLDTQLCSKLTQDGKKGEEGEERQKEEKGQGRGERKGI
jgi:hypothetical protein